MVSVGRNSDSGFVRCIALCLLNILDWLVTYFNRYAFTEIAIYGKSYCEAAKDTWDLLGRSGIDAIVNDNLISGVFMFAAFIAALVSGALAGVFAGLVFGVSAWGLWIAIGFLFGYVLTATVMEVVDSGVCALFVCFAEDAPALAALHPEVHTALRAALATHQHANRVKV